MSYYNPKEWCLPFGKHQGQTLDCVPTDYLTWLLARGILRTDELREAVWEELGRRRGGLTQQRGVIFGVLKALGGGKEEDDQPTTG